MKAMRMLATTLLLGVCASTAVAQPAKTLREQLVGTWNFVIAEITTADGKKTLPFGDKPKGMIIFTADGHFSQVHVAGDLPKIAEQAVSPARPRTTRRSCTAAWRCSGPIRSMKPRNH